MDAFFYFIALALGLSVGSFLNVCIYRIPAGLSLTHPPSRCRGCEMPIKPADNIPVLSWLILKGRCRACAEPISWRYPAVEVLTGLMFLAMYAKFGLAPQAVVGAFFACILIVVSLIDLDTKLIPNKLIYPSIVLAAVLVIPGMLGLRALPLIGGDPIQPLIGFLAGGGSLLAIALGAPLIFKKDAMGGGDVKLAAFIGLFLGGYVLLALFFSFFIGALAGIALMAGGKVTRTSSIPFGPYIALGALLALFAGPQLWGLYLSASGLA
ncbi:MAG: prepilin peptidase [Candidatus Aquicultorales bacterium]